MVIAKKLNKRIKVYPEFTVSDWQLYSFSDDSEKALKSIEAALALNKTLSKAVNAVGSTRTRVALVMRKVMMKYSDYGARDTEPWDFLIDVLDEIYGPIF